MTKQTAKRFAKTPLKPDDDVLYRHAFAPMLDSALCAVCSLSQGNSIHAHPEPEKRIVLMLNDYPLGVYTTEALADVAAEKDWKRREPRWREFGLTLGQCCHEVFGGKPVPFIKYHYRNYEFVVDGEARL